VVFVRSFSLVKRLVLAMGMAGFSTGHGNGQAPEGRVNLHYEAHPGESISVRNSIFSGQTPVSA
jgi:hypothetical protein